MHVGEIELDFSNTLRQFHNRWHYWLRDHPALSYAHWHHEAQEKALRYTATPLCERV
ncbi:hypothetical protein ABH944_006303 [Caballeronia udeis]|uniref:Integrase catalytic region n=1 Tax=Caballeronia udeis TaxID=1232866 RepID=A0ABW8MQR9_9BURK